MHKSTSAQLRVCDNAQQVKVHSQRPRVTVCQNQNTDILPIMMKTGKY